MPTILIDYLPAELKENKEWYVRYYVLNPATKKLHLKKVKLNRIKSIAERRRYGRKLVSEINKKLESGWNPFIEQESAKSYHLIYDVFETFLSVKTKELRPDSIRSYKSNTKILIEFLYRIDKDKKMFAINFTSSIASEFMNYMYVERNVSARRFNGMLTFTKTLFNWMVENQYIKVNPFKSVKRKKERKKIREIIPISVRNDIHNYLEKENFHFLTFLMIEFHSLLRPTEILRLRISDINIKKQVIEVRPENAKNGNYRLSTIPDVLVGYLEQLNLHKYDENLYAFSDDFKPGPHKKNVRYTGRKWDYMRTELGFKKEYQTYSLRDTGIINLLQSGVSPEEVAKQAGHSDLKMTSIYALHANKIANEQIKSKTKKF